MDIEPDACEHPQVGPEAGHDPGPANEIPVVPSESAITPDEIDYRPPPAKRSFMMHVHMHMLGRGEPMPYALDDDDLE